MEGSNALSPPEIESAVRRGTFTFHPNPQIQPQASSRTLYPLPVVYPGSRVPTEETVTPINPANSSHPSQSSFRPAQMNKQNVDPSTSEARSRQIREMYSSLVGYLVNKSTSNASIPPGSIPPSMRDYRPPTRSNETNVSGNMFVPSTINGWNDPAWEDALNHHSSMASTGLPSASLGNTPGGWAMSDAASISGLLDVINPTPSSQVPVMDVFGNIQFDSRGQPIGQSNTALPLNYDTHPPIMMPHNPENPNTNFFPSGAESTGTNSFAGPYNLDPVELLMTEMGIQRGLDDAWLSLAQTYGTEHANAMLPMHIQG